MATKDRAYYRQQPTSILLEEAKRGVNVDWQELGIALAERLEDVELNYLCPECDG